MTDKNHAKIWKKIKPVMDSIEAFMNLFIFNAQDMRNTEEEYRLSNLKRTYARGIMMAESAKYLPIKNRQTYDGYDFNAPAIVYCYEQVFSDIAKKNKNISLKLSDVLIGIKNFAYFWFLANVFILMPIFVLFLIAGFFLGSGGETCNLLVCY